MFDTAAEANTFRHLEEIWEALPDPDDGVVSGALVTDLLALEGRLRTEGRWTSGPSTLAEVWRLADDEVRNCRVLRWLMDPLAQHGLGTVILTRFLGDVAKAAATAGIDHPPFIHPEDATVSVEVTRGSTRADLVIGTSTWTVVIEAKVWASEHDGQGSGLADEWPEATHVFLTRTGKKMDSAGDSVWLPYAWRQALDHAEAAFASVDDSLSVSRDAARARLAVRAYLDGTGRLRT